MKKYVGIDVGGTEIKYALLDEKAQFLEKGSIDTPHTNLEAFVEAIGAIVDRYKPEIEAVVMSVPGRVDSKNGYMFTGGALRYIYEVNMAGLVEKRVSIPVVLENDAKCAALAELWMGSLKGVDYGMVLTLGTGIGGGIVTHGKLLRGYNFAAGELSNLPTTIKPVNDPIMAWAQVNGTGSLTHPFAMRKGLDVKEVNGKRFFEAYHAGDEDAHAVMDEFTSNFANAIYSIQTVLDNQRVAIGGGISAQDVLIEKFNEKLNNLFSNLHPSSPIKQPEVVRCTFGNDSNLIGALYHYLYE